MATDADELRRLLAELERRPRLKRDPRVLALMEAAKRRLAATSSPHLSLGVALSPGFWVSRLRQWIRSIRWRFVAETMLDLIVLLTILVILPNLYLGTVAVFSQYSLFLIAVFWALLRIEIIRVVFVELVLYVSHICWFGFLWVAEVFSVRFRRTYIEMIRLNRHARDWWQKPRPVRDHQGFLAFVSEAFALEPSHLAELRPPPDIAAIPGLLGRLGNPAFRWPGDIRLLPSSVRSTLLQALRLRRMLDTTAPTDLPTTVTGQAEDSQAPGNDRLTTAELNALNSRIKALQEEIAKIQRWNVRKPEEERSQALLIKEKHEEINSLRARLQLLSRK